MDQSAKKKESLWRENGIIKIVRSNLGILIGLLIMCIALLLYQIHLQLQQIFLTF